MTDRATFSGHASFLGFAVALVLCISPNAVAQLSADPYNPWNSQYESYVYPTIPGTGGGVYSGQAAFELPSGNRGANRFSEVTGDYDRPSLDKDGARVPLRRGVGVPYTRAYRDYDRMYDRIYTPNRNGEGRGIDDEYNENRQKREEAYATFAWRSKERASLQELRLLMADPA